MVTPTNMVTGRHNVRTAAALARQSNSDMLCFGLGRVHLQAVRCHPMADVHDALTEMNCGGGYVVAMTMRVKLGVISVRMELHIVLVYLVSQVRNVQQE